MFASPLPPGPDIPSLTSIRTVGRANTSMPSARPRLEEQQPQPTRQAFDNTRSILKVNSEGNNNAASVAAVQRQQSADPDSRDLNLTASLEAFVAGIQDLRAEEPAEPVLRTPAETASRGVTGSVRARSYNSPPVHTVERVTEHAPRNTMEDYGRSAYMQSAVNSVFPEAYTNSYVVAKDPEPSALPTTASSYQVVLSDGTSYPSAVFPTAGAREATSSILQPPVTSQVYSAPPREISSYPPYVDAIHYAEPATTAPQATGGTTNYYTSYYRRQFPSSPIVADSAVAGDDGVPAVSLPHDRDEVAELSKSAPERRSTPNMEAGERDTITRLTEPMLLVDGVLGLPLKGQGPSEKGTALLTNPLAHNRESRLVTAKKKLLPRPMQLIHVNRWDGKEVLTVDENARRWLAELSTQYVAVISICGELQTGKSGLANLLLDENVMSSSMGFAVGASGAVPAATQGSRFVQRAESEGKTEGVWMSAVEAEGEKDNLIYLILDYEGIGSKRKSVEHDQRLFTLALLVSNFLVFVTRGAVDSDTLFSLASASAWTQRLRVAHGSSADRPPQKVSTPSHAGAPTSPSGKGKTEGGPLTPKAAIASSTMSTWRAPVLLWLLQDFNMSMVDEQQNPLTAGDYLEALLSVGLNRESSGSSKLAADLEQPQIRMARQEVSELFSDRDCVALPSPLGQYIPTSHAASGGQSQARTLEAVSVSEFVPLYQRRLTHLRCRVFRDCKGRALDGTALTGTALTRILEKLVEGINGGDVPESLRLLGSIQHDECRRWKQVCEEAFTKELRETFQSKLPVSTKELQEGAEQLQRKYCQHFKIHAIGDEEVLRHYKMQLKEKLRRITERAIDENDKHAEWKCRQKAKMLSDKLGIDQKISGRLYIDLQALNDDLALLRQEYNAEIRGPRHVHQRVLNDYVDQLLSKGARAVADALKDLARDSERTAALLHQKTLDADRKGDKANKLEQELQNKDCETEQLRRELEDEREQQTLQEERHKQETKELRRELAEQRETNQRLSALYHSRIMDDDDAYRYGARRSKHSAVGVNDQARCFGNRCSIM
ncbi:hypothetical protein Emed_001719 [Eimeria media]